MNNIMICGSREMLPGMADWAQRAVKRAFINGWTIGVGDAVGVDAAVAQAAIEFFHLHPDPKADKPENAHLWTLCRVFGLAMQPRHGVTGLGVGYTQLTEIRKQHAYEDGTANRRYLHIYNEVAQINSYAQRDRILVENAQRVLCLWNGRHKPSGEKAGTWRVYEYAYSLNKEVWIKDFSKG